LRLRLYQNDEAPCGSGAKTDVQNKKEQKNSPTIPFVKQKLKNSTGIVGTEPPVLHQNFNLKLEQRKNDAAAEF
jgi:hypothetical protein